MTEPYLPPARPRPRPGPQARPTPRAQLTGVEIQPSQVVAAAGSAIVTAAKVGRLLGRSGWRLARQLPGARTVEREAQRLQHVAVSETRRFLQMPQTFPGVTNKPVEERAVEYLRTANPGAAPLRSAMSELLERSVESSRTDSRDYLYGTIISQLVPDEARILAALADGSRFAAGDVVQHLRRTKSRVVLANASSVGRQAGLSTPDSTPTYLTRLLNFGLVEFGPEDERLAVDYDILFSDHVVQRARESARGARFERKTLQLSPFGHEFWQATDPSRPALPRA